MKKIWLMMLVSFLSYILLAEETSGTTQSAIEEAKVLIQKLDSNEVNESNKAYEKLLELAKKDKKVADFINQESQNESNSFNTRYMLKRIITTLNHQKETTSKEDKQETPFGTPIIRHFTISLPATKAALGIKGISINNPNILTHLKDTLGTNYQTMDEFLQSVGLDKPRGVFVLEVEKNYPAEKVLKTADIILKIDNIEISDWEHLKRIVEQNYKP
ncbi:MAG: PDZ domain-containing protein, partial [Planctomycetota bacterium]